MNNNFCISPLSNRCNLSETTYTSPPNKCLSQHIYISIYIYTYHLLFMGKKESKWKKKLIPPKQQEASPQNTSCPLRNLQSSETKIFPVVMHIHLRQVVGSPDPKKGGESFARLEVHFGPFRVLKCGLVGFKCTKREMFEKFFHHRLSSCICTNMPDPYYDPKEKSPYNQCQTLGDRRTISGASSSASEKGSVL